MKNINSTKTICLAVLLIICSTAIGQICTPDPQYANGNSFLYPLPDTTMGNDPTLGIYEPACIGSFYDFTMTMVVQDSLDINGIQLDIDSVKLNDITGLPAGLSYSCSPPSCNFEDQASGCFSMFGTTNSIGNYNIEFEATVYFNSDLLPFVVIVFPDAVLATGEYTLRVQSCGPAAPIADFSTNQTVGCTPFMVTFSDDSFFQPTAWSWTFPGGNPATSTQQNPVVTYNSPGSFDVSLTATNSLGTDTKTIINYINPTDQQPSASFSTSTSNLTVSCTNASVNAQSYIWNFGDGTTSFQTSPSHTYNAAGNYTISLDATGYCGTQQTSQTITAGQAPIADFVSSNTQGCAPLSITFFDQSLNHPTSWNWTFEGGTPATSNQPNQVVTFDTPGNYTISLTVANDLGTNTQSATDYIVVDAVPQAEFSYSINDGTISFTNLTMGATSFSWDFGNGFFSNVENPTHTFNQSGTYNVTLTTNSPCGNSTTTQSITIVLVAIDNSIRNAGLHLSPNPNNGNFLLHGEGLTAKKLEWSLYSLEGKLIDKATIATEKQAMTVPFEIKQSGIYFLIINIDGQLFNEKIIVH